LYFLLFFSEKREFIHYNFILDLTGGNENQINLWQYQQDPLLMSYQLQSNSKINQIRFNSFGTKFGAVDSKGSLELWNFEVPQDFSNSFHVFFHSFSFCYFDLNLNLNFKFLRNFLVILKGHQISFSSPQVVY